MADYAEAIRRLNRRRAAGQADTIRQMVDGPAKGRPAPSKGLPLAPAPAASRPTSTPSRPASTPGRNPRLWPDGKIHSISYEQHKKNVTTGKDDRNPLYDPTKQLSGSALHQAAQDLTNLEFGPQRSALARELSDTTTQGQALIDRAAGYQRQTAATDAAVGPQVEAIQALLQQRLTGSTGTARGVINANADAATARQTDAAASAGVGPAAAATGGITAETQQQLDRLATQDKGAQDYGAAQTANYAGLAQLSAAARAQGGNEVVGQLATRLGNAQGDVRSRQADLAAAEGPALASKLAELRQQGYENLVTQQGLDIKTADLAAETSQAQAKLAEQKTNRRQLASDKAAERQLRRDLDAKSRSGKLDETNDLGYTNREWQNLSTKQRQAAIREYNRNKTADTTRPSSSKSKGMSENARQKRTRIDSIITDIGTDPKLSRHVSEAGPRLVQILVNRGADPLEAQAAAEVARHGKLTAATLNKLKRAGIKIPPAWIDDDYLNPGAAGPPAP